MRTTVQLDDDTAAAIQRLRKESGLGLSEAINALIRKGLRTQTKRRSFVQRTAAVGVRIDVANVAEALEVLEGPNAR